MINELGLQNTAVFPHELSIPEDGATLTPTMLAAYWGVHVHTIYRDIEKGALPAFRMPSGRYRIRRDDARRYGRPVE